MTDSWTCPRCGHLVDSPQHVEGCAIKVAVQPDVRAHVAARLGVEPDEIIEFSQDGDVVTIRLKPDAERRALAVDAEAYWTREVGSWATMGGEPLGTWETLSDA